MKVLWIVNTIFPYPAKKIGVNKCYFGGWLNGLADNLKNNNEIKLAIATVYNGRKLLKFNDGKIIYYLVPNKKILKSKETIKNYWKEIDRVFNPDIIHIHGTEIGIGKAVVETCSNRIIITSIQGLVSKISQVYIANIENKDIINNITFRDIIKQDNILQQQKKFRRRGKNEVEIIKKSNAIIGRTTWDYANVKAINPDVKYYIGNETLREVFYNKNWNIENIERHTLFCSQAGYPIKGFHYLVQAIYILKKKYSDIKLYVAGNNIVDSSTLKSRLKKSGYAKYIESLIKKYELQENIVFTGLLDEEQMLQRLLKTHVFVLPSAIENSSNSLGEAMLLGMPCVASNAGGTMDILEHKKEGYLYPYTEPAMCAEYISRIFENDNLAITFGKEAQAVAYKRHNPIKNVNTVIEIYKQLINGGEVN